MNPGQQLLKKIRTELTDEAQTAGNLVVSHSHENVQLRVEVTEADKFSVFLSYLEMKPTKAQKITLKQLQKWAKAIAEKISYLREGFHVLEVDASQLRVQLRSDVPKDRNSEISFYEIVLNQDGSLRLNRFRFDKNRKARSMIPFNLTNEVFEELVNDLTETAHSSMS